MAGDLGVPAVPQHGVVLAGGRPSTSRNRCCVARRRSSGLPQVLPSHQWDQAVAWAADGGGGGGGGGVCLPTSASSSPVPTLLSLIHLLHSVFWKFLDFAELAEFCVKHILFVFSHSIMYAILRIISRGGGTRGRA